MWRRRSVSCRCRAGVCDNNRFHKNKGRARATNGEWRDGGERWRLIVGRRREAFACVGLAPAGWLFAETPGQGSL